MKTPTLWVSHTFVCSTTLRLYFSARRPANYPSSNFKLQRSSLHPSKALRTFSRPALCLTRPSESAQPREFLTRQFKGGANTRKLHNSSRLCRIRNSHCERREFSEYNHSGEQRLESQISPALYILPLIVLGAWLAYDLIPTRRERPPVTQNSAGEYSGEDAEEIMEPLPGRPGNLTAEEEEKLRKFWEMFLQVCGVIGDDGATESETVSVSQGKPAAGTEKPKKKRMSLFKRKKDKDKENSASKVPAMDSIKENDPEDKWGENKAYLETLATHSPEQIRATIWAMVKHDHPDALLLRFLRARKWDLQRALVMLMSTMNWRCSEAHVDDEIMVNGEETAAINEKSGDEKSKKIAQDFLAQLRMGKSYCYGTDKAGRPICIVRARLHKAGEQSEEGLERFTVYLIETTRFMLNPPVDTAVRYPAHSREDVKTNMSSASSLT